MRDVFEISKIEPFVFYDRSADAATHPVLIVAGQVPDTLVDEALVDRIQIPICR